MKLLPRPAQKLLAWGVRQLSPSFTMGVTGILFNDQGLVYVQKHRFWPDQRWGFPGGFLKHGETLPQGLTREVFEESGLAVILGPLLEVEPTGPSHFNAAFCGHLLDASRAKLQRLEIIEGGWYPPDALPTPFLNAHFVLLLHHAAPLNAYLTRLSFPNHLPHS